MEAVKEWSVRPEQENGGARVICGCEDKGLLEWEKCCDGRWRTLCWHCGQLYIHPTMGRKP